MRYKILFIVVMCCFILMGSQKALVALSIGDLEKYSPP